jgi:hypothetical protein
MTTSFIIRHTLNGAAIAKAYTPLSMFTMTYLQSRARFRKDCT